jgi:hypothetical protein
MNLPSVCIEHAHGDGLRRPVNVRHKRNRASGAIGAGESYSDVILRLAVESDIQTRKSFARGE